MNRRTLLLALFGGVFVLATVAGLVLAVIAMNRGGDLGVGGRVALIEIDGVVMDDRDLLEQLRWMRDDPTIRGYVVAINSPGGVVAPSQSIYQTLAAIRDSGTPVVAAIGSVGASGGYYIALAADSIYIMPGSITGSIGVVMEFPNAAELMDRIGFAMETVQSHENKDIGSPFRPMTEEDRAILGSLVDDVYNQFVDVVAHERGLPRETVLGMADGRLFSGRQAVRNGLADTEGNVEAAIAAAGRMADLGDDPRVLRPPEPRVSFLDLLLQGRASLLGRVLGSREAGAGPALKFVPAF